VMAFRENKEAADKYQHAPNFMTGERRDKPA
jgi:hypothetical protein